MYWKVVYRHKGKLESSSACLGLAVQYQIKKWTKPRVGMLFIYNTLNNALDHASPGHLVFECEADGVIKPPFERMPAHPDADTAADFWKSFSIGGTWTPPKGTLLADRVKLVTNTGYRPIDEPA